MRFNNGTLSITFTYDMIEDKNFQSQRMGQVPNKIRKTTCAIRQVRPDEKAENGREIATAFAYRNPVDPDNKFLARKIALTRALKVTKFEKSVREKIWKEYLGKVSMPV